MVIDFANKEKLLNEDYLSAVGYWSKYLLNRMFGDKTQMVGTVSPDQALKYISEDAEEEEVLIRGRYRDVKAYAQALGREKDYILSIEKYGRDHMVTKKIKAELDMATNRFESLTGIKWPFK